MYENDKITINWLKIIVRVVIAFLILMLTIKLVSICLDNSKNSKNDKKLECFLIWTNRKSSGASVTGSSSPARRWRASRSTARRGA